MKWSAGNGHSRRARPGKVDSTIYDLTGRDGGGREGERTHGRETERASLIYKRAPVCKNGER